MFYGLDSYYLIATGIGLVLSLIAGFALKGVFGVTI